MMVIDRASTVRRKLKWADGVDRRPCLGPAFLDLSSDFASLSAKNQLVKITDQITSCSNHLFTG